MSDLISRAEAIKMITSLDENVVKHSSDMKILAVERIKRLPVAYDVDKVVEELEKIEQHCLDMSDWQGQSAICDAIEIVKQGYKSDDLCEKMQMQAYNKAVDNCLKILYFHQNEYDGIQWAIREIEELKEMESD